jgi:HPt (histidine-containing phosphotransfer) domain-containing protein
MTGSPAPIDVAAGVARMMGDRQMFLRVLARFCDEYDNLPTTLRAALAAGDTGLALRLVHTLKGACGMIEAGPLQAAALALEERLRMGAVDYAGELALLEAELARVTEVIL